jgi:protoheme IX farnesyltransferase
MGLIYLGSALVLGAAYIAGTLALHLRPTLARAMALFRFSIVYLALLFASVAVDALVRVRV